jgi:hypothetical protein
MLCAIKTGIGHMFLRRAKLTAQWMATFGVQRFRGSKVQRFNEQPETLNPEPVRA